MTHITTADMSVLEEQLATLPQQSSVSKTCTVITEFHNVKWITL